MDRGRLDSPDVKLLNLTQSQVVSQVDNLHPMIETYNLTHLGDNLIHLNYLRRLNQPAIHYAEPEYLAQLEPLTENSSIQLKPASERTKQAVNSWSDKYDWLRSQKARADWATFHMKWFELLSDELKVTNPIRTKDDLLFDYPKLTKNKYKPFDYLILNCPPRSGQFPNFNQERFKLKVKTLQDANYDVWTVEPTGLCPSTREHNMDVSDIGNLSNYCSNIIAIDTGPLWPTFNVNNIKTIESRTILGYTFRAFSHTPNTQAAKFIT